MKSQWCRNDLNTRHSTPYAKSKKLQFRFYATLSFLRYDIFYFFRLKIPLKLYMEMWREIWISLISCNFTPFHPIEMEFLPEIIEFYTDNQYSTFHIILLNFNSDAKFGHHLWRHNSSQIEWNNNQLLGNISTYFSSKSCYILCILLLSIAYNSKFWELREEKP